MSKYFKWCTCICLLLAIVLVALGSSWVFILKGAMISGAKEKAALTQANEAAWKGIPGNFDIDLDHKHYFFSCVNSDDVIYKGEKAIYEQYGPFTYREYQTLDDVQYDQTMDITGTGDATFDGSIKNSKQAVGLKAKFQQFLKFKESPVDNLDEPLTVVNQAAMGIYWGQKNSDRWRYVVALLYKVVHDLGRQLTETAVHQEIQKSYIKSADDIKTYFFADMTGDNEPTTDQLNFMFTDKVYGLNNATSYSRWSALNPHNEGTPAQLVWDMELRSYFGLNRAQLKSLKESWRQYYSLKETLVFNNVPGNRDDFQTVGFWQWSQAYVTNEMAAPADRKPSVTQLVDTVSGFPEISYWRDEYLQKSANVSDDNKEIMKGVQFSNPSSYDNLERLFDVESGDPNKKAPPASSLFNLTTLKRLLTVGEATESIFSGPNVSYTDAIKPHLKDWQSLSWDTGFCTLFNKDIQSPNECQVEQVYLLYHWISTLEMYTFQRKQEQFGSIETGVISSLGAQSFQKQMELMQLELPSIVYAHAAIDKATAFKQGCAEFFNYSMGFSTDQTALLCADSSPFQNITSHDTMYKVMNIWFYRGAFNADYEADMLKVLNMTDASELDQYVEKTDNIVTAFAVDIHKHYNEQTMSRFCVKVATQVTDQCSWMQMFIGQWAAGTLMFHPMDGSMSKFILDYKRAHMFDTLLSYRRVYPNMTQANGGGDATKSVDFTPEFSYFAEKGAIANPFTTEQLGMLIGQMSSDFLYNQEMWGDLYLKARQEKHGAFQFDGFVRYMRYVTIQAGLGGIYTKKSPRQIIEGYNDTMIETLRAMPAYAGGDQTKDPLLAINKSATNPEGNVIGFFSGDTGKGSPDYSYLLTRQYAQWLGRNDITLKYKDYTDLYTVENVYMNPWREQVIINGTDGFQFHPMLTQEEQLVSFVADFARQTKFRYRNSDLDWYAGIGPTNTIEMMNFELDPKEMQNFDQNPENKKYNTLYDGTVNLESVLKAPVIGTKGHFYQLQDSIVKDSAPVIRNHDYENIVPTKEEDDTWLGIEKNSGVCLQAHQRIQMSFMLNGSSTNEYGLFANFKELHPLIPFVFVQRESVMTKDQVSSILSSLVLANQLRIPMLVGLLCLGAALFIVAGFCYKKHRDAVERDRNYDALENKGATDELTYSEGLGNVKLQNSDRNSARVSKQEFK